MIAAPSHVRTVLKRLRYATLDELIGRSLTVSTHVTLQEDVERFAREISAAELPLQVDVRNLCLQIAKYGMLDLSFQVAKDTFDCSYRRGKEVIRELGFGSDSDLADLFPEYEGMMPDIASDLIEDKWHLLIFARMDDKGKTGPGMVASVLAEKDLSLLPLPSEFRVLDACVTNTTYAWFAKHFYI